MSPFPDTIMIVSPLSLVWHKFIDQFTLHMHEFWQMFI